MEPGIIRAARRGSYTPAVLPAAVRLVLASASPRRLELLRSVGIDASSVPSGHPEHEHAGEPPHERVARLAADKAAEVAASQPRDTLVLGADTTVVLDGGTLEKPRDAEEAAEMLRRLSGRTHHVLTGVCLRRAGDDRRATVVERTAVRFRAYGENVVRWYVGTGEPLDKAGAYGIQGRGVFLSDGIEGSWSNVVGLPLERLPELFAALGVDLPPR